MTYWSSQSFRTLNHWQSNKWEGSPYDGELPLFGEFQLYGYQEEERYVGRVFPPRLRIAGSLDGVMPNDFTKWNPLFRDGISWRGFNQYIGVFDLGESKMEVVPVPVSAEGDVVFNYGLWSHTFHEGEPLTFPVWVPTIRRIGIVNAIINSDSVDLLPEWIKTNTHTGSTADLGEFTLDEAVDRDYAHTREALGFALSKNTEWLKPTKYKTSAGSEWLPVYRHSGVSTIGFVNGEDGYTSAETNTNFWASALNLISYQTNGATCAGIDSVSDRLRPTGGYTREFIKGEDGYDRGWILYYVINWPVRLDAETKTIFERSL